MNSNGCEGTKWWSDLTEECPITLETLSSLRYPPFQLQQGYYFDGAALASYIVSRGVFQNPLTRQDLDLKECQLLDEYIATHGRHFDNQPLMRNVKVAEAFALRNSVQVVQQAGSETNREQRLRNTAAAALAGLFVYGSDRRGAWNSRTGTDVTQSEESRQLLQWGFDLSRPFHSSAVQSHDDGWSVIDDDEMVADMTQQDAYSAVQSSFPHLTESNPLPSVSGPDDPYNSILPKIQAVAIEDEKEDAAHQQRLLAAQQRLLNDALRRREERKQEMTRQKKEAIEKLVEKKQESEELCRAREEIEKWRDNHWERLRIASEAMTSATKKHETEGVDNDATAPAGTNDASPLPNDSISNEKDDLEASLQRKKAKAAAKRQRQKAKKQLQKREQNAKLEAEREAENKAKLLAESAMRCALCGTGILDCGFEKYGKKFCSPKCARTATKA